MRLLSATVISLSFVSWVHDLAFYSGWPNATTAIKVAR
jgi:hypothetical protein